MKKLLLSFGFSCFLFCLPNIGLVETISLGEASEFNGEAADNLASDSLSSAGDIDGDSYDDFLIGAYGEGTNGAAYLIYGNSSLLTGENLSGVDAKFTGASVGDNAGASVAGVGDVDNDGYDDFIISADDFNSGAGAVYLYYGSSVRYSGTASVNSASARFNGVAGGDSAGFFVAPAGDVDNDGYADFLIGADGVDTGGSASGSVYLIYGRSSDYSGTTYSLGTFPEFIGEADGDYAGYSVFSAGDVDNDGYDDILIGAMSADSGRGALYLFYGQNEDFTGDTDLSAANAKFTGEASDDYAGWTVSSAGDVNNDGFDDFITGTYGNGEGGSAYLFYGDSVRYSGTASLSTASAKFTGEAVDDAAGYFVAGAGDVDNDGYDDFLVGARSESTAASAAGAAYLISGQSAEYSGTASLSTAGAKFTGEAASDFAGTSVAGAGDVNGDGQADILVGASGASSSAGIAYLGYLYLDTDGDGVGGTDGLLDGTDCNDDDNTISANQTYYTDYDNDGYGSSVSSVSLCSNTIPAGYVTNNTDTNDNDHDNDNSETDTDCNDDDATVSNNQTYYQDLDGDGLGNALVTTSVCSLTVPAGYVTNSTDTNDTIKDISTIIAGDNGDITITYVNNDISTIDVFDYTGTDDIILQQYQDNYYLALHPKAKKLALIDINALTVLSRKTLSKKSFPTNSLKTYTLRNKPWAVITAKNSKNKVKLSLVKIVITQEKLGKKVAVSLINKKITPSKTKKNKNTILLRSKKNKIITKYLLTKKINLKEI
ncbi:MAG: integrin alpha [Patescibacteria group bacterium]|jgi:hypothetical protein